MLLQDDAEADAAEALLACAAVVDLAVPGGALLYASHGLEQLVGISLGSWSGSAKGLPGLGALLEQGPGSEALRVAAKSGVPGGAAVALLRHDGSRRAPRTLNPKSCRWAPSCAGNALLLLVSVAVGRAGSTSRHTDSARLLPLHWLVCQGWQ